MVYKIPEFLPLKRQLQFLRFQRSHKISWRRIIISGQLVIKSPLLPDYQKIRRIFQVYPQTLDYYFGVTFSHQIPSPLPLKFNDEILSCYFRSNSPHRSSSSLEANVIKYSSNFSGHQIPSHRSLRKILWNRVSMLPDNHRFHHRANTPKVADPSIRKNDPRPRGRLEARRPHGTQSRENVNKHTNKTRTSLIMEFDSPVKDKSSMASYARQKTPLIHSHHWPVNR